MNKRNFYFTVILLLSISGINLWACGSKEPFPTYDLEEGWAHYLLDGIIVDQETNEPIPDIEVFFWSKFVYTNEEGRWVINEAAAFCEEPYPNPEDESKTIYPCFVMVTDRNEEEGGYYKNQFAVKITPVQIVPGPSEDSSFKGVFLQKEIHIKLSKNQ